MRKRNRYIELLHQFEREAESVHKLFDEALEKPTGAEFERLIFPGDPNNFYLFFPDDWKPDEMYLLDPFGPILKHWKKSIAGLLWINILIWTDKEELQLRAKDQHHIRLILFKRKGYKTIIETHKLATTYSSNYIDRTLSLSYLLYPSGNPKSSDLENKPNIVVTFHNKNTLPKYSFEMFEVIEADGIATNTNHNALNEAIINGKEYSGSKESLTQDCSHNMRKLLNKFEVNPDSDEHLKRFCLYLIWLRHIHPKSPFYYYVFPSHLDHKEGIAGIHLGTKKPLTDRESKFIGLIADTFGRYLELSVHERRRHIFVERVQVHARKATIAEIINRNYAHHIGAHVSPRATFDKVLARLGKKIGDLSNSKLAATIAQLITILDVYKDERNEFIANLNNEPFYQPSYLYQDVVLPFIENTLLMDNIAANEGIEYKNPDGLSTPRNQEGRGQIDPNTALNQLVIRVFVDKSLCSTDNTKDQVAPQRGAKNDLSACPDGYRELKAVYIFFDSNNNRVPKYDSLDLPYVREIRTLGEPFYDERELTCNDILVSLPNPLAKHAFYSILENFIRNTAKHSYDPKKHSNKIVEIIIRVTNKGEGFYRIELTDSISCISNGKLAELRSKIKNTDILEGKDRGIADMKINACLLAGLGLTDKNMKSSLDVDIDSEGHLIYRFSLLKHKEVAVIGYNGEKKFEDKNAGFYDFSDLNEYSRCQVKNFRFAVVDCSTIDESSLKKLIHQLPYRLLLINASNDSEFVTLRRAVKVSKDVFAVESKETFLENCWKKWLDRFGENNLDMRIFFQQKRDEEPTQKWSNAIKTLTNQAMSATVCYLDQGAIQPTNDLSESNKYYILYDRHAKLAEKLKVSLLEKNFYEQIDKNSADFPLLFNARTEQKPFLFPYELAEAGLLKILILDERVAEATTDILGGYYDSILKNGFKKAGNNCRNSNNITRFDACWAAGIYIGTHISDKPLSREIDEKSNHYLKIKFEKERSSSHIKIKGTTNFAQWDDKLKKDLDLRVDVMVIHRTKLKDLCDDWNSRRIDFLESLDVPKVIITTGGGVVDFVDPKKWQILPTNVIRDFVLSSSPAKLSLVRKIIS